MRHKDKFEIVDGVAGNARITGMVSVVLLVLLIAEAATIPLIGRLRGPHIFIGMLLLGPLALKLSSTGYRFARYYGRTPAYVSHGPPVLGLRLLAPVVVVTTVALFATGVALLIVGPGSGELKFIHKLSFIVWVAFVSLHILGHLIELPRLATPDWRRSAPEVVRLAGAGPRILLLTGAVTGGVALGFLGLSVAGSWLS
jgi:hypothetical protein